MKATRRLPEGYREAGHLDISGNIGLQVLLSVVGLLLFAGSGWLLLLVLAWMRPEDAAMGLQLQIAGGGQLLLNVLVVALVAVGVIVLHEIVHGLFFWLFTGSRPVFAFKIVYAYAGAPDWYLPCRQYMVVGAAPLVVITTLGLLLLAVVPQGWLLPVLLFTALNAGGAVGDLGVVAWLLVQPAACLANDEGDRVTLYRPRS